MVINESFWDDESKDIEAGSDEIVSPENYRPGSYTMCIYLKPLRTYADYMTMLEDKATHRTLEKLDQIVEYMMRQSGAVLYDDATTYQLNIAGAEWKKGVMEVESGDRMFYVPGEYEQGLFHIMMVKYHFDFDFENADIDKVTLFFLNMRNFYYLKGNNLNFKVSLVMKTRWGFLQRGYVGPDEGFVRPTEGRIIDEMVDDMIEDFDDGIRDYQEITDYQRIRRTYQLTKTIMNYRDDYRYEDALRVMTKNCSDVDYLMMRVSGSFGTSCKIVDEVPAEKILSDEIMSSGIMKRGVQLMNPMKLYNDNYSETKMIDDDFIRQSEGKTAFVLLCNHIVGSEIYVYMSGTYKYKRNEFAAKLRSENENLPELNEYVKNGLSREKFDKFKDKSKMLKLLLLLNDGDEEATLEKINSGCE